MGTQKRMFVRRLRDCGEFVAGDGSLLRELLHAGKGDFAFHYSLAHASVGPGKITRWHTLKSSEVYYILAGQGVMFVDAEKAPVEAGCVVSIPPGARQRIENSGDENLVFLCIVDPAWREEDESVQE